MSAKQSNPLVENDSSSRGKLATAELDRDDIQLSRSFCTDTMDFTEVDTIEARIGHRHGRRRRSQPSATTSTLPAQTPSPTPTINRRDNASLSSMVDRPGGRTSRRAIRRAAITTGTDGRSTNTTTTNTGRETGLAEYLRLSISISANLTDHATIGDSDNSWHVFEENRTIFNTSNPSLTSPRPRTRRPSTITLRSRQRQPNTQSDNESSTVSNDQRKPRLKKPSCRRRLPPNAPRGNKKRPTSNKKISSLADAATSSIECPICLYNYDERENRVPCTFRCGHSMCLAHKDDLSTCPICRASLRGQNLKRSIVLCQAAAAINDLVNAVKTKKG